MSASSGRLENTFVAGGRRSVGRPPGGGRDEPAAPAPARADGVELLGELPGSGYRNPPALVRRADGQTVQLTPLLYELLQAIDGKAAYEELAALLSARMGRHATADDVRFLTETKLRPLGLLQRPDGGAPAVAAPSPLLALRLKLVVSNPAATRIATAPFAWLFHPAIVAATVIAFALTTWWVLFEKGLASATHQLLYRPALILVVLGLTLLSAAFHEIGHAAACRYGGASPGRMGIGLYLVWPAFYTDVSDSYRLSRGGRLRVDLGGLYFNAIFAVAIFGIWTLLHWDALVLVIAAQLLLMVRQLVPFVRFDGYHILADLVGVPDLFRHIKPTLLALLPIRRGRAERRSLKRWVRAVVTLWVLLVVPLLATVLVLLVLALPRVAATAWASLGVQFHALQAGWAHADPATVVVKLLSMLLIVLPAAGSVYLLVRIGRRSARKIRSATAGRPALRGVVALALVAVSAALAWAWWPEAGRYRPITSHDRGRLVDVPRTVAASSVVASSAQVVKATPTPPERTAAGAVPVERGVTPRHSSGHAEWMLLLVPRRPSEHGRPSVPPTVHLPSPVDLPSPIPDPQLPDAPPTIDPPEPLSAVADGGDATAVTVVPPKPATSQQANSQWPFPFDPPPAPKPGDNQALAVNTKDRSTTYVVALSLVWVTDGGPVAERNTAFAAASCTGCQTVAVAFQAVFVVGYAQVVTPINNAVAVNYQCDTCATGALAVQLVAGLSRMPSESALQELTAVWAQLQQVSKDFQLQPLAQVRSELAAAQSQLLAIVSRDGALATGTTTASTTTTPTTTHTTTAPTTNTTTAPATTDATTTTPTTTDTTTTPAAANDTTTSGATTTAPTRTEPITTTGTTTAETTTAETSTQVTTTAQTTTAQTTTAETTTTTSTAPTTTSP